MSEIRWLISLKFQIFMSINGQRNSIRRKLEHAMTYKLLPKRPKLIAAKSAFLTTVVVSLCGCASLLNEDTQELNVRVMCSGKAVPAFCRAENNKGSWTFNSPGKVIVIGDNRGLDIACKTQFSQPLTVTAPALPSWEMAGNLFFGGLIGGAVDIYNHKGLRYPDNIDISHSLCK
jgi:hypothetical protein